jgi:hypothetical protein
MVWSFTLTLVFLALVACSGSPSEDQQRKRDFEIGYELLNALYLFDPMDLVGQDIKLENILSEELYWRYSLTNDLRQLNAYLRFMNQEAYPVVVDQREGRITFYFLNPNIASNRTFVIEYRHNGYYVTHLQEYEIFFMPLSGRWFWEDE